MSEFEDDIILLRSDVIDSFVGSKAYRFLFQYNDRFIPATVIVPVGVLSVNGALAILNEAVIYARSMRYGAPPQGTDVGYATEN